MTNKEAIEILKANIEYMYDETTIGKQLLVKEIEEASNLAIKALTNLGCGCGLCLAHNNMICPILKEEKNV